MAAEWPADRVERRPISELSAYVGNARTHSDAQVEQIAASIREWGWTIPILVDETGTLIAGHGRLLAAKKLGLTEAPVMVARGWTDAQRRAYVIADNRLALNAGWDEDVLRAEISDLAAMGADLSLTGFADAEVAALLGGGADLMDPMDGGSQTSGDAGPMLRWGSRVVPLNSEEVALLDKALDAFVARRGVAFGFVASVIGTA